MSEEQTQIIPEIKHVCQLPSTPTNFSTDSKLIAPNSKTTVTQYCSKNIVVRKGFMLKLQAFTDCEKVDVVGTCELGLELGQHGIGRASVSDDDCYLDDV